MGRVLTQTVEINDEDEEEKDLILYLKKTCNFIREWREKREIFGSKSLVCRMKRERSHELSPDRMAAEDGREGRKNSFFSLSLSFLVRLAKGLLTVGEMPLSCVMVNAPAEKCFSLLFLRHQDTQTHRWSSWGPLVFLVTSPFFHPFSFSSFFIYISSFYQNCDPFWMDTGS